MKPVGLFSLVFGFLFLVACMQSPPNSTGPSQPHFQLNYSVNDNGLKQATQAAQEKQAFTASVKFSNTSQSLKKVSEENEKFLEKLSIVLGKIVLKLK